MYVEPDVNLARYEFGAWRSFRRRRPHICFEPDAATITENSPPTPTHNIPQFRRTRVQRLFKWRLLGCWADAAVDGVAWPLLCKPMRRLSLRLGRSHVCMFRLFFMADTWATAMRPMTTEWWGLCAFWINVRTHSNDDHAYRKTLDWVQLCCRLDGWSTGVDATTHFILRFFIPLYYLFKAENIR